MTNKTTAKNANVIVVTDSEKNLLQSVGGAMFADIDFDSLNKTIDKIGEHSGALDSSARDAGLKFVEDWEGLIVKKLQDKEYKLSEFRAMICKASTVNNINSIKNFVDSAEISMLIENIDEDNKDTENLAEAKEMIKDEIIKLSEYENDNKPRQLFIDTMCMTNAEIAKLRAEYNFALSKFDIEYGKRAYKIRKQFYKFKNDFDKNPYVKKFLKTLDIQIKNAGDAQALAKEKASLAKMNMVIPDADIRKLLKDLNEFQKNI